MRLKPAARQLAKHDQLAHLLVHGGPRILVAMGPQMHFAMSYNPLCVVYSRGLSEAWVIRECGSQIGCVVDAIVSSRRTFELPASNCAPISAATAPTQRQLPAHYSFPHHDFACWALTAGTFGRLEKQCPLTISPSSTAAPYGQLQVLAGLRSF